MSEATLPLVRRARGYRLYTEDGRRLLDLYLDGGAALLGHRPELLGRELKNVAGRGLLGNLPSSYPARLRRILRQALPGHSWFGIAATADDARRLLRGRVGSARSLPLQVADPLSDPKWCDAQVAWWRPLCGEQPAGGEWLAHGPPALLHRLPFAVGAGPVTVSTRQGGGRGVRRLAGCLTAVAGRCRGRPPAPAAYRTRAQCRSVRLAGHGAGLAPQRDLRDGRLSAPAARSGVCGLPGRRSTVESALSGAKHSSRYGQCGRSGAAAAVVRHPPRRPRTGSWAPWRKDGMGQSDADRRRFLGR